MILVVGATGDLGTTIVRKLVAANQPVRAFVRRTSRYQRFQGCPVELAFGDLRDPASIDIACKGVDVVIATANVNAPEGPSSFEAVQGKGYRDLISASKKQHVKQFIYCAVPVTPHDNAVPHFRYNRLIEEHLKDSGLNYAIFRSAPFMECWFSVMGSTIPARGSEAPFIRRQYWFLKLFMQGIGNLIEGMGIAMIPGNRYTRHSFIALDDVGTYMVNAINHPQAQRAILHVGGPEILSWKHVVDMYGKILGRRLKAVYTPGVFFRVLCALMSPFSEAASNIMGLNWLMSYDTLYQAKEAETALGVSLTNAEDFLRLKANLPKDL